MLPHMDLHEVRSEVIYCDRLNSHKIVDVQRVTSKNRRFWVLVWCGPRLCGNVVERCHKMRRLTKSTLEVRNSAYASNGMIRCTWPIWSCCMGMGKCIAVERQFLLRWYSGGTGTTQTFSKLENPLQSVACMSIAVLATPILPILTLPHYIYPDISYFPFFFLLRSIDKEPFCLNFYLKAKQYDYDCCFFSYGLFLSNLVIIFSINRRKAKWELIG